MSTITEDAFWDMVDTTDVHGCWLWMGTTTPDGYGVCSPRATGTPRAHRAAYVLLGGNIPEGLDLDHLCRVRHCVRPSHLEPVTRSENVKRGWDARRPPGRERGYRTPARSYKPPPELYERAKAKAEGINPRLTVTDVLVHALEEFVDDKWEDWR